MATAPAALRTRSPSHAAHTRLAPLDGLRGIAICAVVAFHVAVVATRGAPWAGGSSPPATLWPLFAGKVGVDVFFVLSGFLVLRSWNASRERHGGALAGAGAFARRRLLRIGPAYWFSLLILIPLRTPEWLASFDGLRKILMFVTFEQFLDPQLPHQVNVVTWSLTTEVHFYVLLPLLAFAIARYGASRVLLVLLAWSVAWRVMRGGTGEEAEWILGRVDQFVAGMAASTLVERTKRGEPSRIVSFVTSRGGAWALTGTGLAAAVPLGAFQLVPKPVAYMATVHEIAGLVIAGLIIRLVVLERPRRVLDSRILRGIALVSYSLYLWHWVALSEAVARFGPGVWSIVGGLGFAGLMTVVSYACFERPSERRVERPADERDSRGGISSLPVDGRHRDYAAAS